MLTLFLALLLSTSEISLKESLEAYISQLLIVLGTLRVEAAMLSLTSMTLIGRLSFNNSKLRFPRKKKKCRRPPERLNDGTRLTFPIWMAFMVTI
uniref:Predicted protein n=2 Tax=Mesangiospermae TaxID=1437183 RepID=F2DGC2_HORVV|nr:predicted protein [Hordeum vulgare subsp. vulgare]